MRRLGLSLRTEEAYVGWVRRFIRAHDQRHPRRLGASEVEALLTLLVTRDQVSASTQSQALSALLFLYREVLELQLPWMDAIHRAQRPGRLPTVQSRRSAGVVRADERDHLADRRASVRRRFAADGRDRRDDAMR